ncbi:hypothetical protein [Hyphomonas pacifica]|uniref:Uncharacterized protein n=1 Tax=Hyphomonas pacifica TaxID=1280941 RepID=A0A8B2PFM5_9PROT|nr:hypothetical protein [Hyphomonas pacifica]RAN30625.1 hypothetical protein HY3_05605 [Hyphomonas pacifica]
MKVFWAHVISAGLEEEGRVVSYGVSNGPDVFLQDLDEGCTALARPPIANDFGGWRYNWDEGFWQRLRTTPEGGVWERFAEDE